MQRIVIIISILLCCNLNAAIIFGNPEGNPTIDFVYDYQCSYCHKMWVNIKRLTNEDKNIKVKLYPIFAINMTSLFQASSLVYLAINSNKFYEINDYLLTSKSMTFQEFKSFLNSTVNIDQSFLTAIRSSDIKQHIDEGITLLSKNNIESVPFISISNEKGNLTNLNGYQNYDVLQKEVLNAS